MIHNVAIDKIIAAVVAARQQKSRLTSSTRRALNLKIELVPFTGKIKKWQTWSRMPRAQTRSLVCVGAFDVFAVEAVMVCMPGFDSRGCISRTSINQTSCVGRV